jgi:hypothetical protein
MSLGSERSGAVHSTPSIAKNALIFLNFGRELAILC